MPIDILNSFGKLSGSLTSSGSTFNKILSSPIYAAILLTIIVIVLVIVFAPTKKKKIHNMVKLAIYILMGNTLMMFLHDSALVENTKEHVMGHKNDGILDQMTTNGRASDPLNQNRVAVVPFKKKSNTQQLIGENKLDQVEKNISGGFNKSKKPTSNTEEVKLVNNENIGGGNNENENNIESDIFGGNPLLEEEITGGEEILYGPKSGGSKSPKFGVF
jgi:hypothetical protein